MSGFSAEREGFEPPVPCSTTVFKTAAIDHSAISPQLFFGRLIFLSVAKVQFYFFPTNIIRKIVRFYFHFSIHSLSCHHLPSTFLTQYLAVDYSTLPFITCRAEPFILRQCYINEIESISVVLHEFYNSQLCFGVIQASVVVRQWGLFYYPPSSANIRHKKAFLFFSEIIVGLFRFSLFLWTPKRYH